MGPGKGSQLPYVDGVKALVIPGPLDAESGHQDGRTDVLGSVNHGKTGQY